MSAHPLTRQTNLDGDLGNPVAAQALEFRETQRTLRERFPREWDAFEQRFVALALAEPEGVTSYEVAESLARDGIAEHVRRSLRGCVPGNLVSRNLIVTRTRENAEHSEAKGRKVGRYVATSELRVLAWVAGGRRA